MENSVILSARHDRDDLVERRNLLAAELSEVDQEIAKIDAFIEMYARYAGDAPIVTQSFEPQPPLANLKAMTIADGCAAILRSQGGRARLVDMVRLLERAGKLKSTSHRGNYGSVVQTLQRFPDRFEKVGKGEWSMAEARPALLALK